MSITDEIKQKLDIVEIISEYATLQKSGHNFKALCPFHSEKTPSFFVFPDRQSWHCFGSCGTGGDIISFVMKKENLDFTQALQMLAERAGIRINELKVHDKSKDEYREKLLQINEAAAAYYQHLLLHTSAGKKAKDYLLQRGLSQQSIENFQLGFSKDSYDDLQQHLHSEGYKDAELLGTGLIIERDTGGYYDRFRNRVMFPIRDIQGDVIAFGGRAMDDSSAKYLNSPQTAVFDKSSSLYGIDRAKKHIREKDMVVITEGYMDVITAHQHGIENTVAAMGTALNEKHLVVLKKLSKNITLALDADSAGKEAVLRSDELYDKLEYERSLDKTISSITGSFDHEVKVAVLPPDKDLDQVIQEDESQWHDLSQNAQPIIDFLFSTAITGIDINSAKDKAVLVERFLPLLSGIKNPIRQAHYAQQLATLLNIDKHVIEDMLKQTRPSGKKRKTTPRSSNVVKTIDPSALSSSLEEYCLALLFQYPSLRETGKNISPEYFELTENRELFLKWLNSDKLEHIKNETDNILQEHLDYLLHKELPPVLKDSEDAREKDFNQCSMRLRERWLRNIENKKAFYFAELDGAAEQLAGLDEKGIEEHKQLKEIFDAKDTKRKTTA
jgi:DNA primase